MATAIPCPRCGFIEHGVVYVKQFDTTVKRLRRCKKCGRCFHTVEAIAPESLQEAAEYLESLAGTSDRESSEVSRKVTD